MIRPAICAGVLIQVLAYQVIAQDVPKADKGPKRLPPAVDKAWDTAERKVRKNRDTYDSANAKALEGFQKELEKIKPPVNVEEFVLQFQKEIGRLDAAAAPPPPPPPDKDIVVFNGHRYKLFVETLSWEDAKKRCEELGGHLLNVETRDEQEFIHKALVDFRSRKPDMPHNAMVWLGLVQDKANKRWVSMMSGQPQLYSNWEPLQPKESHEHSTMFIGHGRWFSSKDGPHFVVCEWDR